MRPRFPALVALCVLASGSALAQTPLGSAQLVNSTTAGAQETPAIGRDGTGRSLVVWTTADDGAGMGVRGQFYTAAGAKSGGELAVNTVIPGDQANPSVAMTGTGGALVVWHAPDVFGSGVWARYYDAAGVPAGPEVAVNVTTFDEQSFPVVAGTADGFLVAWQSYGQDGDVEGIYARRYDANGIAVSGEMLVNVVTIGAQARASVAALKAGWVVAWESGKEIFTRRLDAGGTPLGGEVRANAITTGTQQSPSVAGEPNGGFVVAWSDDSGRAQEDASFGIFAARFSAGGLRRTTGDYHINSFVTGDQVQPSVTVDAAGLWTVTWRSMGEDGDQGGIYGQVYTPNAVPVGGAFGVSTPANGDQSRPAVTALPDGRLFAVWQHAGTPFGADTSVSAIAGRRFGTNLLPNGSFEGGSLSPWVGQSLQASSVKECPLTTAASTLPRRVDGRCVFRMAGNADAQTLTQSIGGGAAGDVFDLSALSKATGALAAGGAYEVMATVTYADTTTADHVLAFRKSNHDWESRSVTFQAAQAYTGIAVAVRYHAQAGTAWFDEVRLVKRNDPAPAVQRVVPEGGATNQPILGKSISVEFTEEVDAGALAFELACGGAPESFIVSPPVPGTSDTFKLVPGGALPTNTTCEVTVTASQVTDTDTSDPADAMLADFKSRFATETDTAPTATSPEAGLTDVLPDANLTVTFSESVQVAAGAFTLQCPLGIAYPFSAPLPGSGTSFTVEPVGSMPEGATCRLGVKATLVTDQDAIDPPDRMRADTAFTFGTEASPAVDTISPAHGAIEVPRDTNITVTFTESVDLSATPAFTLECPAGSPITLVMTSPTPIPASSLQATLDPDATLPQDTTCVFKVLASGVVDTDVADPPDNMAADFVSTFRTEAPPTVASTTPANGATGVALSADITVNFSEAVNANAASFTLECPAGTPFAGGFATSGSGSSSMTVNPTGDLPPDKTCQVVVVDTNVTDADTNDPPDQMASSYVFSFTTADGPPFVIDFGPASPVASSNLSVTFSEPVTVTANAFFFEPGFCGGISITNLTGPGPATTFDLDPEGMPSNALCRLTVDAAEVSDADTDDPPDHMTSSQSHDYAIPPP
jgi:methionine-rich copper-binding protein CopC